MSKRAKHAVVTGGGRGIGLAIAKALVAAGLHVTITGRKPTELERAVARGHAHSFLVLDATDGEAVRVAFEKLASEHGPICILIANAGAAESGTFLKSDTAMFQRMLDINLMGVVHAVRAVLPSMLAQKHGRIIAIASTAGLKGYAYVTAYTAAKHAVIGFVKALAQETAASGVTVNAVCPGYTETDLIKNSLDAITTKTGRKKEEALADLLKGSPLKRLIRPEEVASACVWLSSEGAGAVTGTSLVVAGGEI